MYCQVEQVEFADFELTKLLQYFNGNTICIEVCKSGRNIAMRQGYIVCRLACDGGYIQRVADGLPPDYVETTDWSFIGGDLDEAIRFLLWVPGDASGLFRVVEEIMDVAGVYGDGYTGQENRRLLLAAIGKIRRGTTKHVRVDFTLSPERQRLRELEFFQTEEAADWGRYVRCLEDPGCAEVLRRGC
jgi:hypothetical protein